MPGKFVLKKNAKGQFHFVLKASNGETIATSECPSASRIAEHHARHDLVDQREGTMVGTGVASASSIAVSMSMTRPAATS
jgi:uncharacterized protein YegP (UPF0339 family)